MNAILFDLDDTLLDNHMNQFINRYFKMLGKHARQFMEPERFLENMLLCTREMIQSEDTAVTNREVFWQAFERRTGLNRGDLEPFFHLFYQTEFPKLADVSTKRPAAFKLINWCFSQGWKVVIATNPVFPATAILERMNWAGIQADSFAFDLITTYENMHSTKPHQSYFQEILDKIDCLPGEAMMVGDNWENDIEPAAALGLATFWIANGREIPDAGLVNGWGSLEDLQQQIQNDFLLKRL